MITFSEAQRLVKSLDDVQIEHEAVGYGDEIIVTEKISDDGWLDPMKYLINVDTQAVRHLGSSPFDWPQWYADDKEERVTLT